MRVTREKIVDELVHNVGIVCREFSKPISGYNKGNFITPLPVTKIEMRNILHKIITGLPVDFFVNQPKKCRCNKKTHCKRICFTSSTGRYYSRKIHGLFNQFHLYIRR